MEDKTKFTLATIILTLIVLSFLVTGMAFLSKGITSLAIVWFTTAVTLIILFVVLLKRAYADMKTGMPSEDEREKKARMYAAGYTYFISLYLWLALMVIKEYLTREQIIGTGIAGMAIIFVISWWYLSKKGDTT